MDKKVFENFIFPNKKTLLGTCKNDGTKIVFFTLLSKNVLGEIYPENQDYSFCYLDKWELN